MISQSVQIYKRFSQPLEPIPTSLSARTMRLDEVRCVLFDIYGTLFISGSGDIGATAVDLKTEACAEMLAAREQSSVSAEQLVAAYQSAIQKAHEDSRAAGNEFPEVEIRSIWREVGDQFSLLPFGDQRDDAWIEAWAVEFEARSNPVWPMPGIDEALAGTRSGHRMGIISNAQFYTRVMFPALLGESLDDLGFESSLSWFSYESLIAKPADKLFLFAAERLRQDGIEPGEVLYVGNDVRNDMAPSARAGFRTALFAGDQRSLRLRQSDPELAGFEPDVVLTDLRQLLLCIA